MKMKKIVASLLALIMVLSLLSGCGGKQETISGTIQPNLSEPSKPAGSIEPNPNEPSTPAGTVESDPDASGVSDAPAETDAPEETEVSLGRMEGGVYTNTYAGFGCKLDSNWEFYTAEELQELPENLQELFADTEMSDAVDASAQIVDMQAENANDMSTINVVYQKMDAATRLMAATYGEEEIIDNMLTMKDTMIASYAVGGMDVDTMEKVEVDFLGEKHFALSTKGTMRIYDIPYYMLQLTDYNVGRYGVVITVNSLVEDKTESLLDLFYPVD